MLRVYISKVCLIWIKHKWMHHPLRLSLELLGRAVTLNILMCFLTENFFWQCLLRYLSHYIFLRVNCLNFLWLLIPHKMYELSYSLLICGLSIYSFTCCLCCTEVLWHLLQTLFFLWKCSWSSISAATALYHVHRQYIRLSSRLYGT